ncbi:kinase-like domain-containing protein, partial [Pelagophyceae sp. CCMP2097]
MERFDVGVLLGRGGFAAVFRALERSTGRSVAIKMIAKQRLTDPGLAARLQREVALHSSLRHAHVVRLYEYFETVGAAACAAGAQLDPETDDCEYVCLVLEYCGGGDLRQLLQREGKLGEAAAKAVLRQICAGVAYLHESRVVHRDLKLANVLLCADGTVKICDFGVAATRGTFDQPEERWTLCGTPNYIAPEVVAGTEAHGTPADAWSIGCVAFALLTG